MAVTGVVRAVESMEKYIVVRPDGSGCSPGGGVLRQLAVFLLPRFVGDGAAGWQNVAYESICCPSLS